MSAPGNTRRVVDADEVLERIDFARLYRAWEPRSGLPGPTRASCPPPSEPCPYVRCSHHLAMMVGTNPRGSDRPGRYRDNLPSMLRPLWLDPDAPTCALHVADQARSEEWSNRKLAAAIGLSTRGLQWFQTKSLRKLEAVGDCHELMELLTGEIPRNMAPGTRSRGGVRGG